jgi:hypothetical protein
MTTTSHQINIRKTYDHTQWRRCQTPSGVEIEHSYIYIDIYVEKPKYDDNDDDDDDDDDDDVGAVCCCLL